MNLYKVLYLNKKGKNCSGKLISNSIENARKKFEKLPHRTIVSVIFVAWD